MAAEPEEQARADMYALLARLLHAAPDATLLSTLARADAIVGQSGHPLDRAWERLVLGASVVDEASVAAEFNALFISVGTPKINPYASLYLTGFINEKPLVALRDDLARLGLGRAPGQREMEDHLGALCEAMRLMVVGASDAAAQPLAHQQQFFHTHIAPWYLRCLHDIRSAPEANFYRLVADFAQAFFDLEAQAFALDDACEAA
ncbi:molecular chaperone TorD family protein [Massilia sp. RP-1-19]|uniref:Molecular chaperone TorD family protein n=1 Tax=Massilia polaris TaxID=2728846 RepID=A0A848HTW8_9BURK|nr:molecular chaperone TorD family protein [Massilia polaris]NML62753.1 molecular chaperone TorD family protein [Massilia polaris]